MVNYANIIEFAREHKNKIIEDMKVKAAWQFIARVNNPQFDEKKELDELKIEERALSIAQELIEQVLEKMENGEKIL